MKRIASGSQAASAPTFPADTGTPGHFLSPATTPSGAATQLTPKWCESVQEAICQTIEGSGAALSDTLSQFAEVVSGVHAVESHATDTGSIDTSLTRALVACTQSRAAARGAACVATNASSATGTESAVVGGSNSSVSGNSAGAFAGYSHTVSAAYATCIGGYNNEASGVSAASVGGNDNTASGDSSAIVGGYDNTATAAAAGVFGCVNTDATGLRAGAVASGACTVSGAGAFVAASSGTTNAGSEAVVLGGYDHDITSGGDQSAVLAGRENRVDVPNSCILAGEFNRIREGDTSAILASQGCHTAGNYYGRALLASKNAALVSSDTTGGNGAWIVGGGYSVFTLTGTETANTAVTWTIDSQNGWGHFLGGVTTNDPSADVAEYHETADGKAIPVGTLVTNTGRRVRAAGAGDPIFGAVSATPGLALGASQLGWSGQCARDEWGREIWCDVECIRWERAEGLVRFDGPVSEVPTGVTPPASAIRYSLRDRVRAADHDPSRPYTPRAERPAEWCPVAKLGLVRVRVSAKAKVGDLLAGGADGVAVPTDKAKGRRTAEVLEIVSAFDAARGFAIALCDIG